MRISSYTRKSFLIYDFATASEFSYIGGKFDFFYQCILIDMNETCSGYMLLASDRETADLQGVRRLASGRAKPLPELMQELHRLLELMQELPWDLLRELRVPPSACLHARRDSRFRWAERKYRTHKRQFKNHSALKVTKNRN